MFGGSASIRRRQAYAVALAAALLMLSAVAAYGAAPGRYSWTGDWHQAANDCPFLCSERHYALRKSDGSEVKANVVMAYLDAHGTVIRYATLDRHYRFDSETFDLWRTGAGGRHLGKVLDRSAILDRVMSDAIGSFLAEQGSGATDTSAASPAGARGGTSAAAAAERQAATDAKIAQW